MNLKCPTQVSLQRTTEILIFKLNSLLQLFQLKLLLLETLKCKNLLSSTDPNVKLIQERLTTLDTTEELSTLELQEKPKEK